MRITFENKMASDSKKQDKKSQKAKSQEEVFNGFQLLRAEQRTLANKLSEFEVDLNEHKMVIETLKTVHENRKCYRMIGGVLCERTVKDVLPALENNREQLTNVIAAVTEQLTKKGIEINDYKEKHNIRIRGQDDIQENDTDDKTSKTSTDNTRGNVLVENPV